MFNVTTLSEYITLHHHFIEQKGLCAIFVFIGFALVIGALIGFCFGNSDSWEVKYLLTFFLIIGLFMEIISFCFMLKVESNIGKLNNEWNQYQIMLEEQEEKSKNE